MRYAILGDIHGNYEALEAVIKYIENEYDNQITGFIFTGDYVGDFADGSKVVDLMQKISKEYKTYIIKGNRETDQVEKYLEALNSGKEPDWGLDTTMGAALISCRELGRDRLNYLKSLPNSCIIYCYNKRPIFVKHKMPLSPSEIERVRKENMVVITGHTHEAHKETKDGVTLFNPGSVGLPDDGIVGATYGIMESNDNDEWTFTIHDVKYDYNKTLNSLKSNNELYNGCYGWGKALELSLISGVNCTSLYSSETKVLTSLLNESKGTTEEIPDYYDLDKIFSQNRYANVNYDGSRLTDMSIEEKDGILVFGPAEVISIGGKPNISPKLKYLSPEFKDKLSAIALRKVREVASSADREIVFNGRHSGVIK